MEEKMYNLEAVCVELGITPHTLAKWTQWEKNQLRDGLIDKPYLPVPIKQEHTKGRPKLWTQTMVNQLKEHKKNMVTGRNGIYGMYTNPNHKNTKKYKKAQEENKNE